MNNKVRLPHLGDMAAITPSEWVQGWILEIMTGYSPDAQNWKRKEGIWEEGVHWRKAPDGRVMYNWRAIDRWVEQEKAK